MTVTRSHPLRRLGRFGSERRCALAHVQLGVRHAVDASGGGGQDACRAPEPRPELGLEAGDPCLELPDLTIEPTRSTSPTAAHSIAYEASSTSRSATGSVTPADRRLVRFANAPKRVARSLVSSTSVPCASSSSEGAGEAEHLDRVPSAERYATAAERPVAVVDLEIADPRGTPAAAADGSRHPTGSGIEERRSCRDALGEVAARHSSRAARTPGRAPGRRRTAAG